MSDYQLPLDPPSPPASKFRPTTIAVWLAVAIVIGFIAWGLMNNNRLKPTAGATAPTFALQLFDGYSWQDAKEITLYQLQGQVVVVNFWASWCRECHLEAAALEQLWRDYQGRGVVFVGIDYVDTEPQALAYLAQYGISYPNGFDKQSLIAKEYQITGVPETFIIDQTGRVAHLTIGPIDEATIRTQLETLLNGQ